MVGTRSAITTSFVIGVAIASAAHGTYLDPFEYTGGEGRLLGLIQNEAGNGQGGAGVFAGAGFGSNMVNVFLADLSNATSGLSNAGVTLFVMWGNGENPGGDYSASMEYTGVWQEGEDGVFNAGVAEIFALGPRVMIEAGLISLGSVGLASETPRGFAITNLQAADEGELTIWFTELLGSIQMVGLFDYGDDTPEMLHGDMQMQMSMPLIVPLPPPLGLALAGLIGVVLLRRRMTS